MVVQHNMQAINANRQLNVTTGQQAKSTEKLSSGYKINRAADDAAGLSISEKMRRQVRGLKRASSNAEDGVSSVQTAEGALNEVHDMLQRMNELATQAANGTNSQTDRESIQSEIDQLTTEIDRVSETTKFNETYLLHGSKDTKEIYMKSHDAGLKGELVDGDAGKASFSADLKVGEKVSIGGKTYTLKEDDGKVETNIKDITADINDLRVGDKVVVANGSGRAGYQVATNLSAITLNKAVYAAGESKTASVDTFSNGDSFGKVGNVVQITYTDSNGTEQVFEMKMTADNSWQKITGYNTKTGDANLGGTRLYDNSAASMGRVANEELRAAFQTATKMVIINNDTGEKVTFGSTEVIKKAVEEETRVGSKVYLTAKGGDGAKAASFNAIYQGNDDYAKGMSATTFNPLNYGLTEAEKVVETKGAVVGDDNSITIHDAKKLMAQELARANGIGVDDTKDVTATNRKSGSDIAQELALNHDDTVTIKKADRNGDDQETVYTVKANLSHETVGVSFENITGETMQPINENSRITVTGADGKVTELYAEVDKDGKLKSWRNLADDKKLSHTDIKELVKDAVAIDYTADISKPELSSKYAASVNKLHLDESPNVHTSANVEPNPTVRWRTAEGMRADISKLDAGDKINVTNEGRAEYNTGDIEVKNDSGDTANFDMTLGKTTVQKALDFNLHVGADADLTNKIGVNIEEMNSKYLGIHNLDVVGKDEEGNNIDDGGKMATYAIDAIQDAINKVNDQRSSLGAVQNRLEHTITNLENVVENTTAAESRIRDTDIASEMVNYSKNNILAQAGQSMLAQANQSTQGALSLLG